jgi:hypothetical protein
MKGELASARVPAAARRVAHPGARDRPNVSSVQASAGTVAEAEAVARGKGLTRVRVSTTNDNLPALYFYQRRQYHLIGVVPGGMIGHVKELDSKGFGGIPLRDELRLERVLT